MKVLVAEDDRQLLGLWLEVFSDAGHEVQGAMTAREARTALLTGEFDVAILDLWLGVDSGLSIATMASYANPDCKIILITGSNLFARGELFELAPSIGTVLRKPVPIAELLAVSEHSEAIA